MYKDWVAIFIVRYLSFFFLIFRECPNELQIGELTDPHVENVWNAWDYKEEYENMQI
jgi:hypothetical protein